MLIDAITGCLPALAVTIGWFEVIHILTCLLRSLRFYVQQRVISVAALRLLI